MVDRSLIHFLVFLIVLLLYCLYDRHQEAERIFKIAENQQTVISQQKKAIDSQSFYIKLLESKVYESYHQDVSPIH